MRRVPASVREKSSTISAALLIYGATGFVGEYAARAAAQRGLRPIVAGRDAGEAGLRGVVTSSDCLALHLKNRLPSATKLTLAFDVDSSAGPPQGTQKTRIEMLPAGRRVRKAGRLQAPDDVAQTRTFDFGVTSVEGILVP